MKIRNGKLERIPSYIHVNQSYLEKTMYPALKLIKININQY